MSEHINMYELMNSEYVSKLDVLDMLVDYFGEYPRVPNPLLNKLDDMDPADVVEVIRCKDCKFNKGDNKCLNEHSIIDIPKDDDYCSYAERKNNDE